MYFDSLCAAELIKKTVSAREKILNRFAEHVLCELNDAASKGYFEVSIRIPDAIRPEEQFLKTSLTELGDRGLKPVCPFEFGQYNSFLCVSWKG